MYNLLKPVAVLVFAAALSVFHQGCNPVKYPLDAPYVAETQKCAVEAKSLSESRLCRANLNWKYGLCPSEVVPC